MNKQDSTGRSLSKDFGITTEKYLTPGSGLYEYIGQILVMTRFFKKAEDPEWSTEVKKVILKGMSDFDPETGTSLLTYETLEDQRTGEVRVIPEGASFGLPEVTLEAYQFTPQSMYYKKLEDLGKLEYMRSLYISHEGIGLTGIKELHKLPRHERDAKIRYYQNLVGVAKDVSGDYFWFRIYSIDTLVHMGGKKYTSTMSTAAGQVKVRFDGTDDAIVISHTGEAKIKFFGLVK